MAWEIFPFSFREFLDYEGVEAPARLSTKGRLLVQRAFDHYWETGGFPEVAAFDRRLRPMTHHEYFHAILFRDLVERHDVSHRKALSDLAHRLVDTAASLYSVNALTGYLKSLGHKMPKSAVSEYLEWFEDAYFLFTVHRSDLRRVLRAQPRQPQEDLLHRPRPGHVGLIRPPRQRRTLAREPRLRRAPARVPAGLLPPDEDRQGGRFRGADAPRRPDTDPGL